MFLPTFYKTKTFKNHSYRIFCLDNEVMKNEAVS